MRSASSTTTATTWPSARPARSCCAAPREMDRYWDNPEGTAATLRDGWLHTGDLGRLDADGFLWFMGRSKELIVRAGSNIVPQEVEEVLYRHPAVHLACVVGLADPHLGERVESYVSLVEGADPAPTGDDLRAFVADRIASYKVPDHVIVLPTTAAQPHRQGRPPHARTADRPRRRRLRRPASQEPELARATRRKSSGDDRRGRWVSKRVVVWGTGFVGKLVIPEIVRHPAFELVGVGVSNPDKVGQRRRRDLRHRADRRSPRPTTSTRWSRSRPTRSSTTGRPPRTRTTTSARSARSSGPASTSARPR